MAPQDAGLSSLRNDELVVLTMEAISAGSLLKDGELIEPMTEEARAAEEVFQAAVEELLRRAGGKPIVIHFPGGSGLCVRP
jgi:hypothetical protein